MDTLSNYLRKRGLDLNSLAVQKEEDLVLENDDYLREVAETYQTHQTVIKLVLQARINTLAKYMLDKAIPEEVIVYRQAMVEIGAIVDDLEKYVSEHERRVKNKTETNEEPEDILEKEEAISFKEGEETSL